jgi:hypothetical protein
MGKDNFGSGKSNNSVTTDLHAGLTVKSPKFPDKSMGMKGGASVNADTTRPSTAPTPKSLSGRTA